MDAKILLAGVPQNYVTLVPSNLTLRLFFKHKTIRIGAKAAPWHTRSGLMCPAAALQRNAGTNIAEFRELCFWEAIDPRGWRMAFLAESG